MTCQEECHAQRLRLCRSHFAIQSRFRIRCRPDARPWNWRQHRDLQRGQCRHPPPPYRDPARLVYPCSDLKTRNVTDHLWSGPDYLDLRNHASTTLEDVAAVSTVRTNFVRDDGTPEDTVLA